MSRVLLNNKRSVIIDFNQHELKLKLVAKDFNKLIYKWYKISFVKAHSLK